MGLDLFAEAPNDEDISKIEINKEFAKRYEHNKKREDLQRLQDLKKKGIVEDSDSSSEDEEEEEELDDEDKDLKFYEVLVKVKKKDPVLERKDVKLFESDLSDEVEEEEESKERRKKKKPMYLKDVTAKHLIEEGADFEEKSNVKSYAEEQEEIRREFLEAAKEALDDEDDDDDDLIKQKEHTDNEIIGNDEIHKKLDEYFGEDENLSENEMFLKKFLRNKMWISKDDEKKPVKEEIYGVSEDEDELEKQDKYEAEYNFRYEEGVGDRVLGHARFIEGSVRKKNNARKLQRKSKEDRRAQEDFERKEELKHLKNLKKKEIMEKLDKIRTVAGISENGTCALSEYDLEEDFDPKEYDKKMKETFDADYYDAEDNEFHSDDDLEKPDFDREDELLGLPKNWEVCRSGDGFLSARTKIIKMKENDGDNNISDSNVNEKEELEEGSKRKRKRKISLREKVALDKDFEEYYKLDYEDTIGDLKTRFKYASVPPNRFGLSPAEILMMDDSDLNQYVSLKKIVPYRQDEWKVPKSKRYHQKMKKKMIQDVKLEEKKDGKMKILKRDESHPQEKTGVNDLVSENESRRKKRRRRAAELKIPKSRLLAYGKIAPKPKSEKKS